MAEIIDLTLPISTRSDPYILQNTRSGGMSIAGIEQVVGPLTGVFKWTITLPLNTTARIRSFRATMARLEGRANYLRTRICDRARIGRRDIGAIYDGTSVPHSDDAPFSDDTGYVLAQPSSPVQVAAARGATSVRVLASDFAGAMSAGLFASINDYLLIITDWALAGDDDEFLDVTFKPPLRAAVEAGDTFDLDARAVWVLDADDGGRVDLRLGRFGDAQLSLTEAIGRSE